MAKGPEEQGEAIDPGAIVPTISQARLSVIIVGLWYMRLWTAVPAAVGADVMSLFLSAMDTTIVTTSLIKISSDFHALQQASWLVTAYLLTYNSFLMISAKLSDIFGIKTMLIICNLVFLVFSMACSGAQTMTQLIVFRAFQGIGGSGLYSLVFVAIMKIVVAEKMALVSGIISSVFALANLLGPVLGGVLSDRTTWRWIFWINGPITTTSIVILFLSMPGLNDGKSNRARFRGFDGVGGILSVCWPVPLLFALQEAGAQFEWKSAVIIATLVTGIVLFFVFGLYEVWISVKTKIEAIFPTRFLSNPGMSLLLLSMTLLGFPFYSMFIQLPQRFQGVNFTTAERAGILLLPTTLLTPVGSMIGGVIVSKKFPAEYVLIIATAMVSIGVGLLTSLPVESQIPARTYGYEVITGFALGLASPVYYILLYTSCEEKDSSVATGALNMVRTLGGAIAVAICSALHHSELDRHLPNFLNASQMSAVKDSSYYIAQLPRETQIQIGRVFGRSYNKQFQVMLAFTLLNVLVALALAIVRKKKGIFGVMPERKQENEFMKKQAVTEDEEAAQGEKSAEVKELPVRASEGGDRERTDQISAIRPSSGEEEDKGKH